MANKIIPILIVAAIPAIGLAAEVRQTAYTFQMDVVQNITSETFAIGEFKAPRELRPPVSTKITRKTNPPLAIRVAGAGSQNGSSRQNQPSKNELCFFPPVLFRSGSALLSEKAQKSLMEALKGCATRSTPLAVRGYTCDLGPQELNDTLARKRAESVAQFITVKGYYVADVSGRGKQDYITTDPQKRHLNRRVEIIAGSATQNAEVTEQ